MNKNKIKRLKIINDLKLKFDSINLENLCAVNHKKENIEFKCKKCGNFFISSIHKLNKFPNSNPCPFCGNFHAKLVNKELFIYKANKIHNFKYSYPEQKFLRNTSKLRITCPKHGEFTQTGSAHIQGQGCYSCGVTSSKGEEKIENFLIEKSINYKKQQTYKDLKYKRPLKFDFYLPDKNIIIEFQGKQHFKPVPFWGGLKSFKLSQKRDKLKKEYCKEKNIKLLEILYNQIDDIDLILKKALL
jgi:predicted RNA-binding Zn-ribbon protein involved in translation (DUF1610 family)